jgi:hypothetical protein
MCPTSRDVPRCLGRSHWAGWSDRVDLLVYRAGRAVLAYSTKWVDMPRVTTVATALVRAGSRRTDQSSTASDRFGARKKAFSLRGQQPRNLPEAVENALYDGAMQSGFGWGSRLIDA